MKNRSEQKGSGAMRNLKRCLVLVLTLCAWGINARGEDKMPALGDRWPKTLRFEEGYDYTYQEGVLFRDTTLYDYPADKKTQVYEIPEGTTAIDDDAFYSADPAYLTQVHIPASCTEIPAAVFASYGLSGVEHYRVAEENPALKSLGGVLYSKDGSTLVAYPCGSESASFTIPEGVTAIGEMAFAGSRVKEVNFPRSLKSIGEYAFYGCEWLETISFQEGLERIGDSAFEACDRLFCVQFPHSLKSVGISAFGQCDSFRQAHFVEGLEELNYCALWGSPVRSLVLPDSLTFIDEPVAGWDGEGEAPTVYIKEGSYADFYAREHLEDWKIVYVDGQSSVTAIPFEEGHTYTRKDGVLFRDTTLYVYSSEGETEIYRIPEGTTGVDANAFIDAKPCLKELHIPSTCTDISENVFRRWGLSKLERYEVAEDNPAFRSVDGVLYSKDGLRLIAYPRGATRTSFHVPEGVRSIGEIAFLRCGLESITCPSSLETIEEQAFAECRQLGEIELSEGLTYIGPRAFQACSALSRIRCPGTLKSIGDEAFLKCGALAEVSLSEGLEELGHFAFWGSPVRSLELPESLRFIDDTIAGWDYEEGEPTVYVKTGSYAEAYAREYLWNWRIVCEDGQKREIDKGAG